MVHKDKISRHHCSGCYKVTLAALGSLNVTCETCGAVITETSAALDCYRTFLSEREAKRRGHAPFSRMWNWARTEGLIDVQNPVALVDKPSLAGQAMDFNFLSVEEADRLLVWSRENQATEHPVYSTALYTGLRMGELWGLRWTDCDLDRGLLTVRRSYRMAPKSGKPRAVPINPALLPVLRQWRNECPTSDEGLVFPTARGYMRQKDRDYGYKDALEGAKCHAIGFHGLRHTFASHFMMSGGNILSLQKLLGHSSVAVTMKYAHLAPDFMRDEIARLRFERPPALVEDLASRRSGASGGQ